MMKSNSGDGRNNGTMVS